MNRRGLLLGMGALLVGEPVRRAYSFLQANPLAMSDRERLMAFIHAELRRHCEAMIQSPLPRPKVVEILTAAFQGFAPIQRIAGARYLPHEKVIEANILFHPIIFDDEVRSDGRSQRPVYPSFDIVLPAEKVQF